MEGFDKERSARSIVAVGDRDIDSIDKAAKQLVHSLVDIDETQKRIKFKVGSFFEHESAEVTRNFVEGRHLSVVKRVLEADYIKSILEKDKYFILAFDEADKCPIPLARMIRSILTHTQQKGVDHVRFLIAGVRPFFQEMVDEDPESPVSSTKRSLSSRLATRKRRNCSGRSLLKRWKWPEKTISSFPLIHWP